MPCGLRSTHVPPPRCGTVCTVGSCCPADSSIGASPTQACSRWLLLTRCFCQAPNNLLQLVQQPLLLRGRMLLPAVQRRHASRAAAAQLRQLVPDVRRRGLQQASPVQHKQPLASAAIYVHYHVCVPYMLVSWLSLLFRVMNVSAHQPCYQHANLVRTVWKCGITSTLCALPNNCFAQLAVGVT